MTWNAHYVANAFPKMELMERMLLVDVKRLNLMLASH